jgi:hypothetical protein
VCPKYEADAAESEVFHFIEAFINIFIWTARNLQ